MSRILLLFSLVFCCPIAHSQTILDKLINQAKSNGLTHIKDVEYSLQSGALGSSIITLEPGEYKIFGIGGYSEVKDIDLYLYNSETNELIEKENNEVDGITILNISLETKTKIWFKVYNMKSAPAQEYFECYLLITKF